MLAAAIVARMNGFAPAQHSAAPAQRHGEQISNEGRRYKEVGLSQLIRTMSEA